MQPLLKKVAKKVAKFVLFQNNNAKIMPQEYKKAPEPLYIKGFEALSTYSTWIVERKICFYCWNISADSLAL